jgi:hypothetical protein
MTKDDRIYIRVGKVPAYIAAQINIRVTRQTVYNWILKGKVNSQGVLEKLTGYKRAGGWYTTVSDVDKFLRSIG